MSLSLILRLNAIVCALFGWALAVFTPEINTLLANQYPGILAPLGIGLILYAYWLWRAAQQEEVDIKALKVFIAGDYGWSLLMLILVFSGHIVNSPMGIRWAMVTALFTAAVGALQFRHFKILTNKH